MQVRNVFRVLGTAATLGAAAFIYSASGDEKTAEKPTTIEQAVEIEKSNPKVFDDYINSLLDRNPMENSLSGLSMEIKSRVIKRLYKESAEAYDKANPNTAKFEDRLSWYLWIVPKHEIKDIFAGSQEELQRFIESYLNAATNPKLKRGKNYDITFFNFPYVVPTPSRFQENQSNIYPDKLFNPKWYEKINVLIKSLKDNSTMERDSFTIRTNNEIIEVLCTLAIIESANNSEIKDRSVLNELLKAANNDPALGIRVILPSLINSYIPGEAKINSTPQKQRYYLDDKFGWKITHDEKIITPIEDGIIKVLTKSLDTDASDEVKEIYNKALALAGSLSKTPFYRDKCSLIWQNIQLDKISKAHINDIPRLINDFKQNSYKLSPYISFPAYRDSYIRGKEYLKTILKRTCDSLLNPAQAENIKGFNIINALSDNYYDKRPLIPIFSQDHEINDLFFKSLQSLGDRKAISETAYLRTAMFFLRLTHNKNIASNIFNSLNSNISDLQKQKQQALNPAQIEVINTRELNLLNLSSELLEQVIPLHNADNDISFWLDNEVLLYKNISEKIVSDSSDVNVLNAAWELFLKSKDLPETDNTSLKEFMENIIAGKLFASILDASNNLTDANKNTFKNNIYSNLYQFFYTTNSVYPKNLYALDKIIDIIAEKSFSTKNDNNALNEVNRLSQLGNTFPSKFYFNLNRAISYHILSHSKIAEQIQTVTRDLSSTKSKERTSTINNLLSFYRSLQKLTPLSDPDTPGYIPLNRLIKDEQLKKASENIGKSNVTIRQTFLDHLSRVNVEIRILESNYNVVIDNEEFKLLIRTLNELSKNTDSNFAEVLLSKVEDRLAREKSPHNRGMLYEAMLAQSTFPVMNRLRKGIADEDSITSKYIGEALGKRMTADLYQIQSPYDSVYETLSGSSQPPQLKLSNIINNLSASNEEFKRLRKGYTPQSEITNAVNLVGSLASLNTLVNAFEYSRFKSSRTKLLTDQLASATLGHNYGLTEILRETYGYHNFKNDFGKLLATNKDGEEVDITNNVMQILTNSKSALGSLGLVTSCEINSNDVANITQSYDSAGKLQEKLQVSLNEITNNLTTSLTLPILQGLPENTAALIELYRKDNNVDLETKIQELNRKLFNGEKSLSLFERYEDVLLYKCVNECREQKRFKESNISNLWNQIDQFGPFKSTNDKNRYKELQKELGEELKRFDSETFLHIVTRSLRQQRQDFAIRFLKLAPTRERLNYFEIAMNSFGLSQAFERYEIEQLLTSDK